MPKNFLYPSNRIVVTDRHPDNGNQMTHIEHEPRNLPQMSDEQWDDPKFAAEGVKFKLGACRKASTGTEIRDIFMSGVRGNQGYAWYRIGTLRSGKSQSKETTEMVPWHLFVSEEENTPRPTTPAPTTAPSTPETAPATPDPAKAQEEVRGL